MGCQSRAYYNSGGNCTKDLVKQVAQQLATRSVRDTDFPDADEVTGEEYVAIVQNGENRKIPISEFLSDSGVRYGTTQYWNNQIGYIPPEGTIVIYSDYKTITVDGQTKYVPGIKVGSGNGYVQDLAFVDDAVTAQLFAHVNNLSIHVTAQEKEFWNNKLNVTDSQEVVNDTLIFNRN